MIPKSFLLFAVIIFATHFQCVVGPGQSDPGEGVQNGIAQANQFQKLLSPTDGKWFPIKQVEYRIEEIVRYILFIFNLHQDERWDALSLGSTAAKNLVTKLGSYGKSTELISLMEAAEEKLWTVSNLMGDVSGKRIVVNMYKEDRRQKAPWTMKVYRLAKSIQGIQKEGIEVHFKTVNRKASEIAEKHYLEDENDTKWAKVAEEIKDRKGTSLTEKVKEINTKIEELLPKLEDIRMDVQDLLEDDLEANPEKMASKEITHRDGRKTDLSRIPEFADCDRQSEVYTDYLVELMNAESCDKSGNPTTDDNEKLYHFTSKGTNSTAKRRELLTKAMHNYLLAHPTESNQPYTLQEAYDIAKRQASNAYMLILKYGHRSEVRNQERECFNQMRDWIRVILEFGLDAKVKEMEQTLKDWVSESKVPQSHQRDYVDTSKVKKPNRLLKAFRSAHSSRPRDDY